MTYVQTSSAWETKLRTKTKAFSEVSLFVVLCLSSSKVSHICTSLSATQVFSVELCSWNFEVWKKSCVVKLIKNFFVLSLSNFKVSFNKRQCYFSPNFFFKLVAQAENVQLVGTKLEFSSKNEQEVVEGFLKQINFISLKFLKNLKEKEKLSYKMLLNSWKNFKQVTDFFTLIRKNQDMFHIS